MKYTIFTFNNGMGVWEYVTPLDKIDELIEWWEEEAYWDQEGEKLPEGVFKYIDAFGGMVNFTFENPTIVDDINNYYDL